MGDEVLGRNKNLNRGFRKLRVWREEIDLYVFEQVDHRTEEVIRWCGSQSFVVLLPCTGEEKAT